MLLSLFCLTHVVQGRGGGGGGGGSKKDESLLVCCVYIYVKPTCGPLVYLLTCLELLQ